MNVITFDYDFAYDPAAPVVEIKLHGYQQDRGERDLRAMIDSGADATLIPLRLLEAVGATYQETVWMRGVTGHGLRLIAI